MTEVQPTPQTFRTLPRKKRIEVVRLAREGRQHPDAAVASAARLWAHGPGWDRLPNRLPQWLLPLCGVLYIVLVVLLQLPTILMVGGVIVIGLGVLGWSSNSLARRIRQISSEPVATGPSESSGLSARSR